MFSAQMADSQSCARLLNPWVLHLQKLGLELKCPACLELYNKPILLPCNHIFCSSCLPEPDSSSPECVICNRPFLQKDTRQAPFIESIVNIYRSLDVTFSPHMHQMTSVRVTPSPLPSYSQIRLKQHGQADAMESDVYHLNQVSHDSPPIRVNSSDNGSGEDTQSLERHTVKKSNKRLAEEFTSNDVHSFTTPLADNSIKKPKQIINNIGEVLDQHSPHMARSLKESEDCGKKTEAETIPSPDTQAIHPSMSMDLPAFVCGFCQTWKVTEHTGPMMHYANGQPVAGKEANGSHVIHVHNKCIEWAPQIYYVDEAVKNLNKELQRGAKLKCCQCKLKGAALGCYAKSCKRTYHVPCAAKISKCRWDAVDFLMLCPAHASLKFPSEKSRKRTSENYSSEKCANSHVITAQKEMEKHDFWAVSSTGAKNWVFCASSLSADEKLMLIELASMCGATVVKSWSPTVTHVLASTDATGAFTRTRKVLMAILKGRWVLNMDWVRACIRTKGPVDEEPYEVSLDNIGCCNGPKLGRLRVINNAPKLFSGFKFLFTGEFVTAYKEDLQDLIIEAGGTVSESKEQLQQDDNGHELSPVSSTRLIVYNCDADMDTGDDSSVLQRQLEAEVLAAETVAQAVPHTWLLDSISSCSLLPFAL